MLVQHVLLYWLLFYMIQLIIVDLSLELTLLSEFIARNGHYNLSQLNAFRVVTVFSFLSFCINLNWLSPSLSLTFSLFILFELVLVNIRMLHYFHDWTKTSFDLSKEPLHCRILIIIYWRIMSLNFAVHKNEREFEFYLIDFDLTFKLDHWMCL